jgi:hypothetical protein
VINATTQPLNPWERLGTHWHQGGMEGAENLAPAGIRSLNRPSRNENIEVQVVSNSMHHNPSGETNSFSGSQIFPEFYGTRSFITMPTQTCH